MMKRCVYRPWGLLIKALALYVEAYQLVRGIRPCEGPADLTTGVPDKALPSK